MFSSVAFEMPSGLAGAKLITVLLIGGFSSKCVVGRVALAGGGHWGRDREGALWSPAPVFSLCFLTFLG